MVSKVLLALCVLVAVASAIPPPFVASAPWFPKWTACTTVGKSCQDCTTRLICFRVGSIQHACTDPALPYCNLGECSATPTTACAPVQAVPATAAV